MTNTQEEVKPVDDFMCPPAPWRCRLSGEVSRFDFLIETENRNRPYEEIARVNGSRAARKIVEAVNGYEALRAEILTLIASNGQLIEENLALTARVEELEGALSDLVRLKNYKDMFGKDGLYMAEKEPAWEAARKALNK